MAPTAALGFVLLIICTAHGKVLPPCFGVPCPPGQRCVPYPFPRCVLTCQVVTCPVGSKCVETFLGARCVAVEKPDCSTMDCLKGETYVQDKVICEKEPCPQPIDPICLLPADPGPCRAYMPSYYFNSTTGQCELFIYGGCRGNANRFLTVEYCEAKCLV